MPTKVLALWQQVLVAVVVAVAILVPTLRSSSGAHATQPIRFSHKVHMSVGDTECTTCHIGADRGPYATLPTSSTCLGCHREPRGTNPEEPKVRAFASTEAGIPWVQVNRLPGHVYFDHRAHVRWGKLDCAECHGDMKVADEPVTKSQITSLQMKRCIGCHHQRNVRTDCVTCHK
jgi:menaquinone reductase, multiheme cytochrome c subunit